MPPTRRSSAPVLTADSWPESSPARRCAIHQPNLFPRLSTLAKLFAADTWVVLDDVQFARRDYQHRARLAALADPAQQRWLSISTHLPNGRGTLIREARIIEGRRCQRRIIHLLHQHYATSPHWPLLHRALTPVMDLFAATDRTAVIAEASTRMLLDLLGWRGQIVRSSDLPAQSERSQRLADLTAATGATTYLCGTGGMSYLNPAPFSEHDITVAPFRIPDSGLCQGGREITVLRPLMLLGPDALGTALRTLARTSTLPPQVIPRFDPS
ncbi:WbqC family protein [Microbispora bryophytorum]|uniref:WbqC family protein n=1 Tax=Microbispora bryophytorum subsp. camponoti TaxID=1677852 RepID=A0ABR8L5W6_9ACTN|nr:WbqC family protein [Microbispora camponoti]MBD3146324.1 WbqC family protein [Microbispora camponoti]